MLRQAEKLIGIELTDAQEAMALQNASANLDRYETLRKIEIPLDTEPAIVGRKYWVRHGNRWVQARIASIESTLDIHTLEARDAHELAVNEIGHVIVETQQPLPVEAYESNRIGGSLIIVDPASNRTSGALLVKEVA